MNIENFAALPFLTDIKDKKRWTITVKKEDKKMPVNINALLEKGVVWGASEADGQNPYMSLTEMAQMPIFQNINNVCLNLSNMLHDGIVILDIEPICPQEIKDKLMALPWTYAETSMSGKGMHLVFPSPKTHLEILETKTALKFGKYYEILLNHNVTFTMNEILPMPGMRTKPMSEFEKIYDELSENAAITQTMQLNTENLPKPEEIPYYEDLIKWLWQARYGKTPEDFKNDISVWEFGFIGFYKYRLNLLLEIRPYKEHKYSDQEKLVILYGIVKERIPYRGKHEEIREGMPILMWNCKRSLTVITEKKGKTQ